MERERAAGTTPPDGVRMHRLDEVTSTQDEAAARLAAGEPPPLVVTASRQRAGRGRLGRAFASPAGASLSLTYAHRTALPPERRGWFALAAGLAAVAAVERVCGPARAGEPEIGLKWPNDLHTADGRKLGGILLEARGAEAVLLGIGMNLRGPVRAADGTGVEGAAWLVGEGGIRRDADGDGQAHPSGPEPDLRERCERTLVTALGAELERLESSGGDGVSAGLHDRYSMTCLTLGRAVRVDPLGVDGPGGTRPPPQRGTARSIDEHGRLVLDLVGGGQAAVDVGDVRHLRPDAPARPTTPETMRIDHQEEHGT